MGLFGPYVYRSKKGQKFWLHVKQKGKVSLYYFSKDSTNALNSIPRGYEVFENPNTGLPFLRRKTSVGLFGKPKESKGEETESK